MKENIMSLGAYEEEHESGANITACAMSVSYRIMPEVTLDGIGYEYKDNI